MPPLPPTPSCTFSGPSVHTRSHPRYPDVDPLGDLNTAAERHLGGLVKQKYGTDFYILHR